MRISQIVDTSRQWLKFSFHFPFSSVFVMYCGQSTQSRLSALSMNPTDTNTNVMSTGVWQLNEESPQHRFIHTFTLLYKIIQTSTKTGFHLLWTSTKKVHPNCVKSSLNSLNSNHNFQITSAMSLNHQFAKNFNKSQYSQ